MPGPYSRPLEESVCRLTTPMAAEANIGKRHFLVNEEDVFPDPPPRAAICIESPGCRAVGLVKHVITEGDFP